MVTLYFISLRFFCSPIFVYQIFEVDAKHVSALLTYDHLWAMCNDETVITPLRIVKVPKPNLDLIHRNWVVEQVPFPFDVIDLLPKIRQVEMVFSSLIETSPQGNTSIEDASFRVGGGGAGGCYLLSGRASETNI